MAKFRNVSGKTIKVGARQVPNNGIIEISEQDAAKFPELQPVGGQMLTEAPIGEAKPVVQETEESKKESIGQKIKRKLLGE